MKSFYRGLAIITEAEGTTVTEPENTRAGQAWCSVLLLNGDSPKTHSSTQKRRGSRKTPKQKSSSDLRTFTSLQPHFIHCSYTSRPHLPIYTTLQQRLLHPHPDTPRPPPPHTSPLPLRLGLERIAVQHPAQGPIVVGGGPLLAPGAPQSDRQVRAVHA